MRNSPTLRLLALLSTASVLAACGGPRDAAPVAPDATYRVRGELTRVTEPERREVWIRHEAIPDFRSETGELVGMASMTMPFPLAQGVSIDGLAVGDRVEFTFEVRWQSTREPMAVTAIDKLPAGTRLEFDPAEPAAPSDVPDATDAGGSAAPTADPAGTNPPKLPAQPPPAPR